MPTSLGGLDNLVRLYISNNQLEGAIPAELGNLRYLTTLDLDGNQFTGEVPARLGNLANLYASGLEQQRVNRPTPGLVGTFGRIDLPWTSITINSPGKYPRTWALWPNWNIWSWTTIYLRGRYRLSSLR